MTDALLVLIVLAPILCAPASWLRSGHYAPALAALPACVSAIVVPEGSQLHLPWLLLGAQLGLDETGKMFLFASSLVWFIAAVYAASAMREGLHNGRFRIFYLLAMTGNFGLILAQDMVTFYLGFAAMGLSAYGLVAHPRSISARRAGRLYLAWTILGEVVLFSASVLLATQSGGLDFKGLESSTFSTASVVLLIIGLGIKLAVPGLHVWLPLTYAAAPAPAAAVLSGPMISAGLLGWMRFLPAGNETLAPWGNVFIAVGAFGAAYAICIGIVQKRPKVVLGYSSMSKMGVLTSGFGIALAHPETASFVLSALSVYAIHHLFVKSALFLGVDLVKRRGARSWAFWGVVWLCFVLAGAPLTSGAYAKAVLIASTQGYESWFSLWLSIIAVASALLLGRLAFLVVHSPGVPSMVDSSARLSWLGLLVVIIMLPFVLGTPQDSLSGGLPIAIGVAFVVLAWRYCPRSLTALIGRIPAGDVLYPVHRAARGFIRDGVQPLLRIIRPAIQWPFNHLRQLLTRVAGPEGFQPSQRQPGWDAFGAVWIIIGGLLFIALTLGS